MSKSALENLTEVTIIFAIVATFMVALSWAAEKERSLGIHGQSSASTEKNRFGGCGHTFFLELQDRGFTEIARVSN